MSGWRKRALSSKPTLASRHAQLVVGGDDQRVDLQHRHVLVDEGLVELAEQVAACLARSPLRPSALASARPWCRQTPVAGSMEKVRIFSGVRGRPPRCPCRLRWRRRPRRGWSRGRPAAKVEFAGDGGAFLDVEAVDLLALGPGLVGDQHPAQHLLRRSSPTSSTDLTTRTPPLASGPRPSNALAAAAGVDLGLHHPDRAAELAGGGSASSDLRTSGHPGPATRSP